MMKAKRDGCGRVWIDCGVIDEGQDSERPLRIQFPQFEKKRDVDAMFALAQKMAAVVQEGK